MFLRFCVHMNECVCLPGAILCTAVDVCPVIQQVLDYAEPAAGTRLMESAVAGVVPVIHLTHSVLQTVQHHLLQQREREQCSVCVMDGRVVTAQAIQDQTYKSDGADTYANSLSLYSSCGGEIRERRN